MNHSPARIVLYLLIDRGVGESHESYIDWPVYQGKMPDDLDQVISVTNTAGLYEGKDMRGNVIDHPGFVVMVRSTEDELAWTKMQEAIVALDAIVGHSLVIEGSTYYIQNITRPLDAVPLGPERDEQFREKRRELYTLNCRMTVRQL